jgi:hypothetical protein
VQGNKTPLTISPYAARQGIHLLGIGRPVWTRDAVNLCPQNCSCLHEGGMFRVLDVKNDGPGEPLRRAPEQRPRRRHRILGECVRQLRNTVVEMLLEHPTPVGQSAMKAGLQGGWETRC